MPVDEGKYLLDMISRVNVPGLGDVGFFNCVARVATIAGRQGSIAAPTVAWLLRLLGKLEGLGALSRLYLFILCTR